MSMKRLLSALFLCLPVVFAGTGPEAKACTRAVYLGPEEMVITGRTMDWREEIPTNLYVFPRGMERTGADEGNTIRWTSKYGSLIASGYDIGTSEGMNEKGLVVNQLYLPETDYTRPNDTRPAMGVSVWAQYVLDNFATVQEAVTELRKEAFRIDAPNMPGGAKSTLHMAMSDATGNSAVLEYIGGKLMIHEGRQIQVLTNSPVYDQQLAINNYWKQIGGLVMLPGTNRASDRFVRASFYINAVTQTADAKIAVAAVFSVMRNVSVPLGISIPESPNNSSTRWRSVSDQKNKVYYFESTRTPNVFWVDFSKLDFSQGARVKKLTMTNGEIYTGDAAADFKDSEPFKFLFEEL